MTLPEPTPDPRWRRPFWQQKGRDLSDPSRPGAVQKERGRRGAEIGRAVGWGRLVRPSHDWWAVPGLAGRGRGTGAQDAADGGAAVAAAVAAQQGI